MCKKQRRFFLRHNKCEPDVEVSSKHQPILRRKPDLRPWTCLRGSEPSTSVRSPVTWHSEGQHNLPLRKPDTFNQSTKRKNYVKWRNTSVSVSYTQTHRYWVPYVWVVLDQSQKVPRSFEGSVGPTLGWVEPRRRRTSRLILRRSVRTNGWTSSSPRTEDPGVTTSTLFSGFSLSLSIYLLRTSTSTWFVDRRRNWSHLIKTI